MTTYLGKSCSFGLPRVPFVNCCLEGRMWDLIVSVPDYCLSFYFTQIVSVKYVTNTHVFKQGILRLLSESGQN